MFSNYKLSIFFLAMFYSTGSIMIIFAYRKISAYSMILTSITLIGYILASGPETIIHNKSEKIIHRGHEKDDRFLSIFSSLITNRKACGKSISRTNFRIVDGKPVSVRRYP